MQRLLSTRLDTDWLGAFVPSEQRPQSACHPQLLLLDGDDPAVERKPRHPHLPAPRRLYFYRHPDVPALLHCVYVRANACLEKFVPNAAVLRALRSAESDLFVVQPELMLQALQASLETWPGHPAGEQPALTTRQIEVVRWAARGLSNKQIARQLRISPETVKTHLQHVFEREGVHSRIALVTRRRDDWSRPDSLS